MEFELHFSEPVGGVVAVDATDVDGPLVGVFGVYAWGRWRGSIGLAMEPKTT